MSSRDTHAQIVVPNSSGTGAPRLKAPANACDCHHHIYDAVRFPQPAKAPSPLQPNARVEEYRLLQRRLQTTRSVVVTPSAYVTDNRVTIDAIAKFGSRARGVAVVRADVTDAELKALGNGGVRGIRFSLTTPTGAATTMDMIEPLSKRVAALGWHIQINMTADQIAAAESLWNRLPSSIVFDHIGHIPGPEGTSHPAYTVMRRLIDKGRTWVKLSVTYDNTADGPPGYADILRLGQTLVKATPERLVWGSNWPHPNESQKPDDARLFDLMAQWAPDEATRHRILVENPAALYDFGGA
jgi:predicted TIM-barrel fold metal-dependent hydrolase